MLKKSPKPRGTKSARKKVIRKPRRIKKSGVNRLALNKLRANPIISPQPDNGWESWQTFNPGVIFLDNKIHFLYRAIGSDGLSRLGYAASNSGFGIDYKFPAPAYEHQVEERSYNVFSYFSGGSWGGAEDPRIVRVDNEEVIYMTYTACNGDLRVGLTSIKVDDFLNKKWNWKSPILVSPPGEVHKNWIIFPEKINGKYAILHSINPEVQIEYFDNLEFDPDTYINSNHGSQPRKNCWDRWVRGIGPVPIKTKYGWLVFYHAMDNDWSKYKVGAMLLDLKDPTKVLHRSTRPVLAPDQHYENNGFKGGVVYASGAVVKDGQLLVYYGAADSYVCVAHADFEKFLDELRKEKQPKLKGEAMAAK